MNRKQVWQGWIWSMFAAAVLAFVAGPSVRAEDAAPGEKPKRKRPEGAPEGKPGEGKPGERKPGEGRPDGEMGPLHFLLRDLKLSEDQQAKVKVIAEEARKAHEAWREAHKDEMDKLHEEFKKAKDADDKAKLKELGERRAKLMETMPKPGDVVEKVLPILNDEQKKVVLERFEEMKKRMEERRKEGGPGERRGPKGDRPPEGKKKGEADAPK